VVPIGVTDPIFIFPQFVDFDLSDVLSFSRSFPTLAGGNPNTPLTGDNDNTGPSGGGNPNTPLTGDNDNTGPSGGGGTPSGGGVPVVPDAGDSTF